MEHESFENDDIEAQLRSMQSSDGSA
ncbi:MAG: hypothetical protein IH898_13025 [Planctomycetes bacterium]|nr:hypothetical protein [Planctomycetota bacterium]